MGVQGLWSLVGPAARPVQLESLRNRKLAVDASIWLHQFMRTMRDKEGSALKNGHLLGFFRRICKLLFYNIKPVFVFDGGAPSLKRTTIRERRRRREGVARNLRRTAQKILSAQMKSRVLMEEEKRRKQKEQGKEEDNEEEDFVYYEELQKSAALEEIKQRHKRDQYELPPIPEQANDKTEIDPRLATREELLDFINEFRPTEEDIDSEAFFALPPEIQYEIVQDLMIKSRQTSWARLEEMVRQSRTALDFSKQQIKQLMKRNEMTQRMLQVAGRGGGSSLKNPEVAVPARIAGERSREYILVKNENVQEGLGWKLPGVTSSAVDTKVQGKKDDDDDDDHCVPELPSKNDEQNSPQHPKEEVDKVRAAVAANPKLAALFPDMDEDEDYEEDYGDDDDDDDDADYVDDDDDDDDAVMDDDDEDEEGRLFLEHFAPADSGYYYGGYGAAGHSSSSYYAVQEALGKMYYGAEEQQTATPSSYYEDGQEEEYNDNNNNETRLNAEEFYNLWLSRVPDAFIYMHSFNDEYKQLIRTAIFDHDMQQLESTLRRVDKVYGKTSARNTLVLESLRFHAAFLQQVISWKQRQQKLSNAEENYETEAAESASVRSSPTPSPEVSRQYQQQRRQEAAASQVQTAPLDKSSGILVLSDDEDEILLQPDPNRTNEKLNKPVDAVQAAVSSESPVEKPSSPSHDYPTDGAPVNYLQNELQEKADASSKKADPEGVSQVQQNKLSRVQDNLQQRGAGSPSVPETNTVDSKEELQEQHSPSKGVHDDVQEGTSPVTPEIDMVDSNELLQEEPSTSNDAQNNVKEEAPSPGTPETNMVDSTEVLQDQHSTTAENEELETQEEQAEPMVIDQGYNSDEELIGDPKAEEDEYARFISDIAEKDIDSVREELYRDMKELNKQQRKEMGNTDDITQQMTEDVQEMLRLFGIPYVVSPMEAEAQCAELARLSLVEGVVTDDSDVFLFGANRIYKNMFNQQKYVECYVAQDIEREMRLDRRKLIQLAYLLGSDYTDGIPGVGPVAAMEILAEFSKPGDEEESLLAPLRRFRSWYESGRDETDFQRSFRKKHKALEFPEDFPNPLVVDAYYHPTVDDSQQQFEWGTPQLDTLRLFLRSSFSWSEQKADEVLVPVIREMNKRKTLGQQTNISTHFGGSPAASAVPHKRRMHSSKRVQKIVNKWREEAEEEESGKKEEKPRPGKRKRRTK